MQTEIIKVTGMTCGGCVNNVTRALTTVGGVSGVSVVLSEGLVTVQYDETLTDPSHLKAAIQAAGYGVDSASTATKPQSKGCCG